MNYHAARNSKNMVIVFSHFVGAKENSLKRHVEFVNSLGFDCVTFMYSWHGGKSGRIRFDYLDEWSTEYSKVVETLLIDPRCQGKKLIAYSFSRPTAGVVKALAEKYLEHFAGLICDSGPFYIPPPEVLPMVAGIYKSQTSTKSRLTFLPIMLFWGLSKPFKTARDYLQRICAKRPDFKILSIRGIEDKLVPLHQIKYVFKNVPFKNLTVLEIEGCSHLNGLKDFSSIYKPAVEKFLLDL